MILDELDIKVLYENFDEESINKDSSTDYEQQQIKSAIKALLAEAHDVALGKVEYSSYNDIFD